MRELTEQLFARHLKNDLLDISTGAEIFNVVVGLIGYYQAAIFCGFSITSVLFVIVSFLSGFKY